MAGPRAAHVCQNRPTGEVVGTLKQILQSLHMSFLSLFSAVFRHAGRALWAESLLVYAEPACFVGEGFSEANSRQIEGGRMLLHAASNWPHEECSPSRRENAQAVQFFDPQAGDITRIYVFMSFSFVCRGVKLPSAHPAYGRMRGVGVLVAVGEQQGRIKQAERDAHDGLN